MADGTQFTDIETGPGEGRWSAPDEVWAAVRVDYLAGLSAPEACRRYGVGLTAMRMRAAREGWRRVDQPWTPRGRLDPDDEGAELEARVGGDLDRVDLRDLTWIAHRRMMRAVMRGEAVEALRWRRVHQAMDEEATELDRFIAQEEAIDHMQAVPDAANGANAANAANGANASDGVLHGFDPDETPADAPGAPDFPAPESRANLDP